MNFPSKIDGLWCLTLCRLYQHLSYSILFVGPIPIKIKLDMENLVIAKGREQITKRNYVILFKSSH